MNEHEQFLLFCKKIGEHISLTFSHYYLHGKDLPESYRDTFYQLFILWEDGCLEGITSEDTMPVEVTQGNMLTTTQEAPKLPFPSQNGSKKNGSPSRHKD